MSKTIKQIAEELGISKQKVYRYIKKNHITESHQKSGVMYFGDVEENLIKQGFSDCIVSVDAHHDVHQTTSNDAVVDVVIDMLKIELELKNKQIEELNKRLAEAHKMAEQAQKLHGVDKALVIKEKQDTNLLEEIKPKKKWQFWK